MGSESNNEIQGPGPITHHLWNLTFPIHTMGTTNTSRQNYSKTHVSRPGSVATQKMRLPFLQEADFPSSGSEKSLSFPLPAARPTAPSSLAPKGQLQKPLTKDAGRNSFLARCQGQQQASGMQLPPCPYPISLLPPHVQNLSSLAFLSEPPSLCLWPQSIPQLSGPSRLFPGPMTLLSSKPSLLPSSASGFPTWAASSRGALLRWLPLWQWFLLLSPNEGLQSTERASPARGYIPHTEPLSFRISQSSPPLSTHSALRQSSPKAFPAAPRSNPPAETAHGPQTQPDVFQQPQ